MTCPLLDLQAIRSNHHDDTSCFNELIRALRRLPSPPSEHMLISVLESPSIGRSDLAAKLRRN